MSDTHDDGSLPALDSELQALFAKERGAEHDDPACGADRREAVLARLEASIEGDSRPASGPWAASGTFVKASAVIGAVFALLYAGYSSNGEPQRESVGTAEVTQIPSAPPLRTDPPPPAPSAPQGDAVLAAVSVASLPEAPPRAEPLPPARLATPTKRADRAPSLAAEYALLEEARQAIARRDYAQANGRLEEHRARFLTGQLAEERESLHVQVLAESGRAAEARDAAARFRQSFPGGFLLPAVEAATTHDP